MPSEPDLTRTAYETCWKCLGAGLQDWLDGPVTCSECHGACCMRVRDDRGRFATVPAPSYRVPSDIEADLIDRSLAPESDGA